MIIKSMSRKEPSFSDLISYMEKEDGERLIYHNFYGNSRLSEEDIAQEFIKNASLLPKRKNGNYLYHEVISFEKNLEMSEKDFCNIAHEIVSLYLDERAKKQLAFAVLHKDTDNPHIHLCISANAVESPRRVRISKAKHSEIKRNIETYVLEHHPELKQSPIYTKKRNQEKLKSTSREQELKKRTQQPSRKEEIKTQLHGIFEQANSQQELIDLLTQAGFALYTRGKTTGVTKDGKKYRLKTLGLLPHYEATNARLAQTPPEKTQTKAQTKQETPEREPPQSEPTHEQTTPPEPEKETFKQEEKPVYEPKPEPEKDPEQHTQERKRSHTKAKPQERNEQTQHQAPPPEPKQPPPEPQANDAPSIIDGVKSVFRNVKESVSNVIDSLTPKAEEKQPDPQTTRTKPQQNHQHSQAQARLEELDQLSEQHAQTHEQTHEKPKRQARPERKSERKPQAKQEEKQREPKNEKLDDLDRISRSKQKTHSRGR